MKRLELCRVLHLLSKDMHSILGIYWALKLQEIVGQKTIMFSRRYELVQRDVVPLLAMKGKVCLDCCNV